MEIESRSPRKEPIRRISVIPGSVPDPDDPTPYWQPEPERAPLPERPDRVKDPEIPDKTIIWPDPNE